LFDPNLAISWIDSGDESYMAARLLWFTGFRIISPVMGHHAIEKYLKGYLVSNGEIVAKGTPAWGHNLRELGITCVKYDTDFNSEPIKRRLSFFERYFFHVRYPSEMPDIEGISLWFSFDSNIQPLDEIVAFVRPRILLDKEDWKQTEIYQAGRSDSDIMKWKKRALEDNNAHIELVDCGETHKTHFEFSEFNFDTGKC
jgi:HEPN domain-containing protein